jgi:hypothetical protein
MFYLTDSSDVIKAKREAFYAVELEMRDLRNSFFVYALIFPIILVATIWWNWPLEQTARLLVNTTLSAILESSLVAIGLFSWTQAYKFRRMAGLAANELARRGFDT